MISKNTLRIIYSNIKRNGTADNAKIYIYNNY